MKLADARNPIQHNRLLGLDPERPARVHWHFRKKCYSVAQYEPSLKGYRVIAHMDGITLRDVQFRVSESGRQRVLHEKVKNVHAHVCGYVECGLAISLGDEGYPLRYNPYKHEKFQRVSADGLVPIDVAPLVSLGKSSCGDSRMEATIFKEAIQ